ncbi:MAG: site-2 protease family protein [Alphaproteobacteria bacterium]|nr:site-2 protease family protein [Alphaproteobacteria bacterium]MBF0130232.1 site-2 protease family protein [Alphaproteobacteria bacterium]
MDVDGWLFQASAHILPVLLAVTLHEVGHGFAAWRLGDDTAYRMGRISLNPLRHVDPFGTVLLPAMLTLAQSPFLFGWAKPVPVAFHRLRNPRWDAVWVSLAGPGVNVLLAVISVFLLLPLTELSGAGPYWVGLNLVNSISINLVLAIFNMLPIPPLDGGRVMVGLLPLGPARWLAGTERHGMLILLAIMFLLPMIGSQIGVDLNVLAWIIAPAVEVIVHGLFTLAGIA